MPHGGRHFFWLDTLVSFTTGNASGNAITLMQDIDSTESRMGMTLMRIIVGMDLAHTVHDSGEGSQTVDVGIGLASQEAFAANVLADPNSGTDFPIRGWLWRTRYRTYGFAADQPMAIVRRLDYDLRAKRKIDNGELYFSLFNTSNEGSTGAVDATGIIRCLYLST